MDQMSDHRPAAAIQAGWQQWQRDYFHQRIADLLSRYRKFGYDLKDYS
jgi:hypothetical protein